MRRFYALIRSRVGELNHRAARMLVEEPYVILYETMPDADNGPVHTVEIVRW